TGSVTRSMVYSMPAQPPFLTPTRMPFAPSRAETISRTRAAAASVIVITWSLLIAVSTGRRLKAGAMVVPVSRWVRKAVSASRSVPADRHARLFRHAVGAPRRVEGHLHGDAGHALD